MKRSFDNSRRNFLGLLTAAGVGTFAGSAAMPAPIHAQEAAKELPLVDSPPVLQCPTENSVAVVWAVGKSAAGFVEFGTSKDKLDQKAAGDVRGLNAYHERYLTVRLEGLKPNTRYYYRTVTAPFIFHHGHKLERQDDVSGEIYSFETPGENKEAGTFSVINDTHNNQKVYKELLMPKLAELNSDYTIMNGDIASSYDNSEIAVEAILRPGGAAYAAEKPMLFVIGNHDHRGWWARNLGLAVPTWKPETLNDCALGRNFAVRTGPLVLIGLDTGEDKPDWHPAWGGLATFEPYRIAQRDWLERTLKSPRVAAAPFVAAFCHIPLYNTDPDANGGDVLERWAQFQRNCGKLWGPLFTKYGVQVVISAHIHRHQYYAPEGDRTWAHLTGGGHEPKGQVTVIHGKAQGDKFEVIVDELNSKTELGRWTFAKRNV
ncbi:MAG: metallophosphoesterase [Planctomycetaceae bacterium]|nr:metallophosphoesterase [Planctomycetaceae bacterium]